ncbi:tetraspanin-15-like [Malaclemys terrapin pileata]|uniref:tetraspanin-15-like n=1 Tax=Malaclemys terrapin pileata TaxID=2991368 RepID=UPI0023A842FA|nr:tetraspanin-15-like [Malaclemys terrapin pileata]
MALLKLFLMAFSFVFWAAGLTMLTLGIWAKISLGSYLVLSANQYPNLLATGAAVLVWGFLGCFSAATEHRCLLRTYAAFQLAVLAAGLSALFYRRDIAEGFRAGLREAVRAYGEDEQKADALDSLQRALDCCGAESYRDWLASPWSLAQPGRNGSVPGSCCRARRGCLHSPLPPEARGIHRDGCFAKVSGFVSDNLFYIATAALGLALLQGVGIVLACLLAARLRPALSAPPPAPGPDRPARSIPSARGPDSPQRPARGVPSARGPSFCPGIPYPEPVLLPALRLSAPRPPSYAKAIPGTPTPTHTPLWALTGHHYVPYPLPPRAAWRALCGATPGTGAAPPTSPHSSSSGDWSSCSPPPHATLLLHHLLGELDRQHQLCPPVPLLPPASALPGELIRLHAAAETVAGLETFPYKQRWEEERASLSPGPAGETFL